MIVLKLAQALLEELSHGTVPRRVPAGQPAESRIVGDKPALGTLGTKGTNGTVGPNGTGGTAGTPSPQTPTAPPDNLIEFSSLIAAGGGCSKAEADRIALAYSGFVNFSELAAAHEARIREALARLPSPVSGLGVRLHDCTLLFVGSPQFEAALRLGWTVDELFAFASPDDPAGMGPVPAWALVHWPAKWDSMTDGAVTLKKPGAEIVLQRFRPEVEHGQPWWNSDEIIVWS